MRTAMALVVLLGAAVGLQIARERIEAHVLPPVQAANLLYVRSPEFMKRAALSYDSLAADIYWIRTLQHYGRTKLSNDPDRQYDLLYPLLDLTTSLDPYFNIAYRFGAIFLAEDYPDGAGRPDLAIALLEKGLRAQPARWEFAQDIGFVHYWWRQDYDQAAEWFRRAAAMPGAPNWLEAMAAVTLTIGGNRDSSRALWRAMLEDAGEQEWLKAQAEFRLLQLDALDQIAVLQQIVTRYRDDAGMLPRTWFDLIRAGYLRAVPADPRGFPYALNPATGGVGLARESTLNPLPRPERPR